jgi:hypothetical protein
MKVQDAAAGLGLLGLMTAAGTLSAGAIVPGVLAVAAALVCCTVCEVLELRGRRRRWSRAERPVRVVLWLRRHHPTRVVRPARQARP